jgi:hypothetical protein
MDEVALDFNNSMKAVMGRLDNIEPNPTPKESAPFGLSYVEGPHDMRTEFRVHMMERISPLREVQSKEADM